MLFTDEQNCLEGMHSSIASSAFNENKVLRLLSFWLTAWRRKDKILCIFPQPGLPQ